MKSETTVHRTMSWFLWFEKSYGANETARCKYINHPDNKRRLLILAEKIGLAFVASSALRHMLFFHVFFFLIKKHPRK